MPIIARLVRAGDPRQPRPADRPGDLRADCWQRGGTAPCRPAHRPAPPRRSSCATAIPAGTAGLVPQGASRIRRTTDCTRRSQGRAVRIAARRSTGRCSSSTARRTNRGSAPTRSWRSRSPSPARAAAERGVPLYRHFADLLEPGHEITTLPRPTINLFSGGKHAGGQMPIQDVLVVASSAADDRRGAGDDLRGVPGRRRAGREQVRHARRWSPTRAGWRPTSRQSRRCSS